MGATATLLRSALMAITATILMLARLMATMGRRGSLAACSSAPAPGTAATDMDTAVTDGYRGGYYGRPAMGMDTPVMAMDARCLMAAAIAERTQLEADSPAVATTAT